MLYLLQECSFRLALILVTFLLNYLGMVSNQALVDKLSMRLGYIKCTTLCSQLSLSCGLLFLIKNMNEKYYLKIQDIIKSVLRVYSYVFNPLDLSFGKFRFWRWIFYGICQTLMLQIIGFYSLEGASALYDLQGQPSGLWVTGTHIYGMVVIIANLKVGYSTNSHSFFSTFIICASIASFYVMVYIESQIPFFK